MDATPSRMTLGSNSAQFLQRYSAHAQLHLPTNAIRAIAATGRQLGLLTLYTGKASRLWTSARVKDTMSSADYRARILNTDQVRTQCMLSCLNHGHARSEQLWIRGSDASARCCLSRRIPAGWFAVRTSRTNRHP